MIYLFFVLSLFAIANSVPSFAMELTVLAPVVKKEIKIVPYNPEWPKMFEVEAAQIKKTLGEKCLAIHHIGSTSVPGLASKGYIDVLCVVDELLSSSALAVNGYEFKGELNVPLRYFFSKGMEASRVHVHVVEPEHGFALMNLCFRDYLRTHDDARMAYESLKKQLLEDPKNCEKIPGSFAGYTLGKHDFIETILKRAGFDGRMVNFCLHYQEWKDYHRIAQEHCGAYDQNSLNFNSPNHYHLVMYNDSNIVTAAHVEFLNDEESLLHMLATDSTHQDQKEEFETYLFNFLVRWAKHHGRRITKPSPSTRSH